MADFASAPTPTRGKKIGVLTSGGDSAGMNAAVRSVVRMGITRGCEVYVIREGWEGLVRGNTAEAQPLDPTGKVNRPVRGPEGKFVATYGEGELLKEGESDFSLKGRHIIHVGWDDVRGFLGAGGTLIGTARCAAFREVEGRRAAAYNLVKNGIDGLVVCGGDGSLTGADKLRAEWSEHLAALLKEGRITQTQADAHEHLNIVGLVGSIDNDMAMTDLTIGAPTALHRICESIDAISSTASSHSRAFVVEVMGRHCGWLALMAGLSTGADYVFIPEKPPAYDDWESEMCEALKKHRELGKRKSIVIVAEGAIDKHLNPIKAEYLKKILTERLGLDTRVTTLGHVQRGGKPCAYDRVLATLQGIEAIEALLSATPETPSPIIGLSENSITRQPLQEAVAQTQLVAQAIQDKDFKKAMSLRDREFADSFDAFAVTTRLDDRIKLSPNEKMRIGIMHVGAPAGGMNAATRTAVRYCLARGHTAVAIFNGWPGLLEDHITELTWLRVDQWTTRGGSELGTNRKLPDTDIAKVANKIREHKLDGLMLIGGFEVLASMKILHCEKLKYSELDIPIVHLPATISNNVPVTEWSLGSDTSINILVDACEAIRQSASASRSRVFVIETQGGECGYIAIIGALAAGAVIAYAPEERITLDQLSADVEFLKNRYRADLRGKSEGRIVIKAEKASSTYKTDVITSILKEEGGKLFDARSVSLGHVLQGGVPSPRDRTRAVRLAIKCMQFLERHSSKVQPCHERHHVNRNTLLPAVSEPERGESKFGTVVITGSEVRVASLEEMIEAADWINRRGTSTWWWKLREVVSIMGGRSGYLANTPPSKLGSLLDSKDCEPEESREASPELGDQDGAE